MMLFVEYEPLCLSIEPRWAPNGSTPGRPHRKGRKKARKAQRVARRASRK